MQTNRFYFLIFCSLFFLPYSNVMSYDEPSYDIVIKNEIYEIRKYSDRLAVETISSNQNGNFKRLFNYISGKNETNEKIKMTTPVTQIEKDGNFSMQFYLPSKFTQKNVPNPNSKDIKIINITGGYYAVIQYSGRSSDKNFLKHKKILQNELKKNNYLILSPPIKATYNSPFTLPMLRRNEAMFKIAY